MGIVSMNKASRLYWLGRYTERVFTGLKRVKDIYDASVDGREADFVTYCHRLGIPCNYADTSDFCRRYFFDAQNPNSLAASLVYAYDNAIVLRDTLTTDTLSYILMAMSAMDKASECENPGVPLQWVTDDIMAFRGSCEENIFDEETRTLIKLGSSVERVDLYLRLGVDPALVRREFERLFNRLYKTRLVPDKDNLAFLVDALLDSSKPDATAYELIAALEGLFLDL
ncbi:MAG: alpha-E domain-containing protein [Faecalibacterium sp.]